MQIALMILFIYTIYLYRFVLSSSLVVDHFTTYRLHVYVSNETILFTSICGELPAVVSV